MANAEQVENEEAEFCAIALEYRGASEDWLVADVDFGESCEQVAAGLWVVYTEDVVLVVLDVWPHRTTISRILKSGIVTPRSTLVSVCQLVNVVQVDLHCFRWHVPRYVIAYSHYITAAHFRCLHHG